jgi:hypothetical protein
VFMDFKDKASLYRTNVGPHEMGSLRGMIRLYLKEPIRTRQQHFITVGDFVYHPAEIEALARLEDFRRQQPGTLP